MHSYILLAALAGATSAIVLPGKAGCVDFTIPVKATAAAKDFPVDLNIADLLADPTTINDKIASYPVVRKTVSYSISAKYCEPVTFNAKRTTTLQVLVHGNTYTKQYWSTPGSSRLPLNLEQYSWLKYASEQGFPTLSIDLPCNGASTRADPLNECQLPLQAEALNEIITYARAGGLASVTARAFNKIIYVGHSYGSLVANGLAQTRPKSASAYILTGFTGNLTNGGLGAAMIPQYQPAALVDSARFGSLAPNYLAATNQAGVLQMFYEGDFVPQVTVIDYVNRCTLAVGEVLTSAFGQSAAPSYSGPLLVLNGNEDEVMCQASHLGPFTGAVGNCAGGFSQDVQNLYPGAKPFQFNNIARTGHSLNFHLSAQESFKAAHDFLKSSGF